MCIVAKVQMSWDIVVLTFGTSAPDSRAEGFGLKYFVHGRSGRCGRDGRYRSRYSYRTYSTKYLMP